MRCIYLTLIKNGCVISLRNSVYDHLLESYWWDVSQVVNPGQQKRSKNDSFRKPFCSLFLNCSPGSIIRVCEEIDWVLDNKEWMIWALSRALMSFICFCDWHWERWGYFHNLGVIFVPSPAYHPDKPSTCIKSHTCTLNISLEQAGSRPKNILLFFVTNVFFIVFKCNGIWFYWNLKNKTIFVWICFKHAIFIHDEKNFIVCMIKGYFFSFAWILY